MDISKEKKSIIALLSLPEIGPRRYRILLQAFGSISAFINGEAALVECGVKFKPGQLDVLRGKARAFDVDSFLELNAKKSIKVITCLDGEYPPRLKDIEDFPPVLYVKGELLDGDICSLAIVGSRKPTSYGLNACNYFSKELAGLGVTLVSGLARGIDSAVHLSAIAAKGRTIAVLGNSLECSYPPENKKLQECVSENGALVSEFPMGTRPDKSNFPRRNRIISALAQGVLVVEAGIKSGSLITARYAGEQGKEVFAVPGPIFSKYSEGWNYLLQHGAALAVKPEDIIDNVPFLRDNIKIKRADLIEQSLNTEEGKIIKLLEKNHDGLHQDEISDALGMALDILAPCLIGLEIKGVVSSIAGARYVRKY